MNIIPTSGNPSQSSTTPPLRPPRFGRRVLLSLLIGYFVGIWLMGLDPNDNQHAAGVIGNTGLVLFWGTIIAAIALDFRGYASLNGLINWRNHGEVVKCLLVSFLVLVFFLAVPIYLVRAVAGNYGVTRQNLGAHLRGVKAWYMSRSRQIQAATAAGACAAILAFCAFSSVALGHSGAGNSGSGNQASVSATHTSSVGAPVSDYPTPTFAPTDTTGVVTPAPTITPIPTATPIPQPTATTRPAPTATPRPQPTNTPTPQCNTGGAPPNPWCYTFNYTGKLIYSPPGNFCGYFNCIASFWQHTNGYVDECSDGTYSHSGGVQGACSYHGGELRPLYAP